MQFLNLHRTAREAAHVHRRQAAASASRHRAAILVGQYDPVTPREYADRAASTLSRSQVVEFPSTGHGVPLSPTLCWVELTQGFLAQPGAPLDTACLGRDYPPIAFDAAVPARAGRPQVRYTP